ncbi:FAD-dependent thymidylate synthase [Peptoniphilus equinus]|uniref:Flavin-dependent thymidylate synthase n=1 Tax=Peptoniphilus equinus TaxID=3016343 RepID=A0ABY7QRX2_9FIRM|nr:FAD-dependent thymidylate synthase [Peptoniphilus equinus]WBW49533.1 FAD-dependent thymidylate synthase [Peptoniphilus equinus]
MKVELIAHTPNPEELIAKSAKLCYSKVGVSEIAEKMTEDDARKFLKMLMSFSHASPIEHASFTFAVEGVSRTLTHQLVRHRIASYSQQSQRYVKLDDFHYVIPPQIEANPEAKAVFIEAMDHARDAYGKITELLMAQKGDLKKSAAEKASIEDARYVFPNACETKIVFTMNARTLLHFFEMRCCTRAQWEIRAMATEMLRQVKAVAPTLFALAGPACVNGPCTEGAMSCGRMEEMRAYYRNLGEN